MTEKGQKMHRSINEFVLRCVYSYTAVEINLYRSIFVVFLLHLHFLSVDDVDAFLEA